jgi:hypothetical protein
VFFDGMTYLMFSRPAEGLVYPRRVVHPAGEHPGGLGPRETASWRP